MGVRTAVIAGGTDSAESFRLAACGLYVPASQINSRTGVTSTPVLTGTGSFTCTIGPFSCVVDGTSNSLQGSYGATLDTSTTVTINAASTQARIDLISLQIQDNAYDGSGVNAGRILYTAGTPGSGVAPTAPANSISLWTVPVAANASSVVFSSATAVFPYTAAAGGIVPVRNATDQPAAASGVQYRHRLDVTAAAGSVSPLESSTDGVTWLPVFDPSGFVWHSFATVWTGSTTNPSLGNGTLTMKYCKVGRMVSVVLSLTIGSTTTLGSGNWLFTLPFTAVLARIGGIATCNAGGTNQLGYVSLNNSPGLVVAAIFGSTFAGASSPGAWANGNTMDMSFTYESTT